MTRSKTSCAKYQPYHIIKLLYYHRIRWWEQRGYPEGIPDEGDYALEAKRKIPSWRRIVKSLLRNDYWCKGLSFTQHRSEAYDKYLALMRRRKAEWREEQESDGILES